MGKYENKFTVDKSQAVPATPTPLPSEEMVPLEDSPENIYNLLVQTIGSSISNRWGYVSVPTTEEEFKEFVENFHKQPFIVAPVPLTPGAVPLTAEEVINRIRQGHRHFNEDDIVRDREELDKYTKLAELVALDFYPQGREMGYHRMLNYFSEVYAKEIEKLEKELEGMTQGREEVDDRLKQEIEERIKELQAKERGLGKLLEVRQTLLQDIKDYMKKRWDAVDVIFDDEFKEALKTIGDANIQGYDGVGIPEEVWNFRQALTQELLKFKKDMTELFNDSSGDGSKPHKKFEEKYKDDPRYQAIRQKLVEANNGTFLPYISFFAGVAVELEDRLKPLVEGRAENIMEWRKELSQKYEFLREKCEYYRRVNSVLGEALKEENPKRVLERIAGDENRLEKERETAMALLSYLSQVEASKKVRVVTIDGQETEQPIAPEPDLGDEFSPELREAIKDIAGEYEAQKALYGSNDFLKALRDIADFRHSRVVSGIGGERAELEVLGEQLSVARKIGDAVSKLREKVNTPGGITRVTSLSENEAYTLNRNLQYRFMMGVEMGREHDYYRFIMNLRSFYNLELMMEKLMNGELTEENIDAIMEEPEFGIGEYIRRKFGRQAFLDVEEALKTAAKGQYKGRDLVPYHLSPDEYIKSIRDYVATKKIREMVQEEGVGRYFGQGVVSRFFTFALTPLGLKPYTASVKFETCVRQALYPDVSAINYAPSHRLKSCMESYQNDLSRLSGKYDNLSRAILNGNPMHFPLAFLGIYFAFLANYMELSRKLAEQEMVELDREIDRAVKEKLLSANSVEEMDKNVKDYFYDELGFRFSVVPRGKFLEEEREVKSIIAKDLLAKDSSLRNEIKDMIKLADEAGILNGEALYVKSILEKSPTLWTKEDIKDFLKLMDKVDRTYLRMLRDGEIMEQIKGALPSYQELRAEQGRRMRESGQATAFSLATTEETDELTRRVQRHSLTERPLKPSRFVNSPEGVGLSEEKLGGLSVNKKGEGFTRYIMRGIPEGEKRKVEALVEARNIVESIRQKIDKEYNARTYTVASEDRVFLVTANPKKLHERDRQFLDRMKHMLSSPLSAEESRVLRRERENFFLRRLGLDRGSLIDMMKKGQIQNGMEYQHVFSKIMSMKEYDLFFGGEEEKRISEEKRRHKLKKVSGFGPSR